MSVRPSRAGDVRKTRAWRRLRDQVVAEEPSCWLQLPGCTRISTTADHVVTYGARPDLGMERSNHRGACEPCNNLRRSMPVESLLIGSADDANTTAGPVPAPALEVFE